MGRFFRTARFEPVDYAFEYPAQMLFTAIAKKDQDIDQTLGQTEQMRLGMTQQVQKSKSNIGQGMYLPSDKETYEGEIAGFETEIDNITKAIYDDPLNATKKIRDITDVRGRINESMTTGTLGTLHKNFNTAKDWLEENKDKDPALLDAVYTQSIEKWGGTAKGGKLELPSTLYDKNIQSTAYEYAGETDLYRNVSERAQLIELNLREDDEIVNTVKQKLDFGLLYDSEGVAYDVNSMTDTEKIKAMNDEIRRQAELAAETTQKKRAPSGSGTTTKGDRTYQGTDWRSQKGKGILVNTGLGNAFNTYGDEDPMYAINEYVKDLDEYFAKTEPGSSRHFINMIEYAELKEHQIKAKKEVDDIIKHGQVGPKALSESVGDRMNRLYKEYFSRQNSTTPIDVHATWGDNFTNDEQKAIAGHVKQVAFDPSKMNYIPIYSSDPTLNGKTINNLIEQEVIQKEIKNQSDIDNAYKDAKESTMKGTTPSIEYDYEKGTATIKYTMGTATQAKPITEIIPLELGKDYANFEMIKSSAPMPTQTGDGLGNTFFMMGVKFNGKPVDIYIPSDYIGSSTYNDVMSDPEIEQGILGTDIYNRLVSSSLPIGTSVNVNEDMIMKNEPGDGWILYIDNNVVKDQTIIKAALGRTLSPIYK